MQRWAVLVAFVGVSAQAAEITRVASSFDDNKPFGMFLDVGFEYTQDKGKLTREWYEDKGGGLTDVSELRYQLRDIRLQLDAHIGLYKDLEFHFGLPIVFIQDRQWNFSEGTNPGNTTLYRNCGNAAGVGCEDVTLQGRGTGHLFEVGDPTVSYRGGLGDLTFGLAYAIFSQARDDTKPTWVLSVDYSAPTAQVNDPSQASFTSDRRGGIGDRIHRYKFSTAISKRLGPLDPYFQLHYTLPWAGPGNYSNCDLPNAKVMGHPENCGKEYWDHNQTGIHPAHVGGFVFGGEFNFFERAQMHQKIALDIRAWLTYTSEGRYNNELSDLMGKLLYSSDYMNVGGHIGFTGHAADFIHIKAFASWSYNTEHFVTTENIGHDLNGSGVVEIQGAPQEINPNFDWRVDRVGRRFRISEQMIFKVSVTASFNF